MAEIKARDKLPLEQQRMVKILNSKTEFHAPAGVLQCRTEKIFSRDGCIFFSNENESIVSHLNVVTDFKPTVEQGSDIERNVLNNLNENKIDAVKNKILLN